MTERHILFVVLALAGAGAGVLVAHFIGVTSRIDARAFLVVGAASGIGVGALLERLRK
jgi:hypothetical protein